MVAENNGVGTFDVPSKFVHGPYDRQSFAFGDRVIALSGRQKTAGVLNKMFLALIFLQKTST